MTGDLDLFGEITRPPPEKKRKDTVQRGYAWQPGTGPEGETCRSCKFTRRISCYSKPFYKCEKNRQSWTSGRGTDILLRAAACKFWETT